MLDRCENDLYHGDEPYLERAPEPDPDLIADERRQEQFDAERLPSFDYWKTTEVERELTLLRNSIRSGQPIKPERYAEVAVGCGVDNYDLIMRALACYRASLRRAV